ncbi:serine hydrolase domain-containing protein [Falsirhodobacter sp. 20TX0035]|uniref:serine hydrolase domain-containing protein n=1 Tax=Falsirhodobacter sp. 20TX0035 TaxID=3022019 RepID=UPI00232BCDDA|nr:serine hydrolase domain-containing protein [Falsirhodobacter sp. 20TX0035]MDB6454867.1 serine hydrolase [Falsirhodobacter sp. 20TX0035]
MHRRILLAAIGCALALPVRAQGAFAETRRVAAGMNQLNSLIVARDGQVLLEEAFRGPPTRQPVNVKSVSKTLVAAATGAAIGRGLLTLDTTLAEVIPDLIPSSADPRTGGITVEDLVTMQAGLQRTSGPNYGAWVSSRNWLSFALSRPFEAEPGARMLYSTGSFHILGAVIARRADATLLQVMRDWIGAPLDIEIPAWTRDPQGFYLGGNEMALSPRAMLQFAEMARTGGRDVLSEDWMRASLTPRTRSPFSGFDYGYGWFLGRLAGTPMALARGYGGQIIALFPEEKASVVITSDPTRPARSEGYFGDLTALMENQILPDLRRA